MEKSQENYASSPYIAELWNTISNLGRFRVGDGVGTRASILTDRIAAIIVPCCLGLVFAKKAQLERRFSLAYTGLLCVGLGSWLFHMTLLWTAQLMDELPMLYASLTFIFCILDDHWTAKQSARRPWVVLLLVVLGIATTVLYLATGDPLVHQSCYAVLVTVIVARSFQVSRRTVRPELKRLFWLGLVSYLTAFVLWNVDNMLCAVLQARRVQAYRHGGFQLLLVPLTQMHAWWHVGVGIGSYLHVLYSSAIRAEKLGVSFVIKVCK